MSRGTGDTLQAVPARPEGPISQQTSRQEDREQRGEVRRGVGLSTENAPLVHDYLMATRSLGPRPAAHRSPAATAAPRSRWLMEFQPRALLEQPDGKAAPCTIRCCSASAAAGRPTRLIQL